MGATTVFGLWSKRIALGRARALSCGGLIFFLAVPAESGSLRLRWDPNTELDLAGYKIYYGTSSRHYGPPIDVGMATRWKLTGLEEGPNVLTLRLLEEDGREVGSATVSLGPSSHRVGSLKELFTAKMTGSLWSVFSSSLWPMDLARPWPFEKSLPPEAALLRVTGERPFVALGLIGDPGQGELTVRRWEAPPTGSLQGPFKRMAQRWTRRRSCWILWEQEVSVAPLFP